MVFLLVAAALRGQELQTLADRIRESALPPDVRQKLEALLAGKNYKPMEELLERQSSAVQSLAAAVYFLDGKMDQAARTYRQIDSVTALKDADRFTWAMAALRRQDEQTAREQLLRLQSRHPDQPLYLYWLARMDYDQRLYAGAVTKLKRVIELDPASARAYDNLGLALDMMNDPDAARSAFDKAVELNRKAVQPSCWPPHNLGALLLRQQRFEDAERALRESLRYDPAFAMGHYHLARVLEGEGKEREAIVEYRAAAAQPAAPVEAFYSLGLLCRRNGLTSEAETAFAEYKKRRAEAQQ